MGACLTTPEDAEAKARSKEIERALKADSSGETLKLLLLGPGESGKSTIFKQIQIIHQKGFAEDERLANRKFVHRNVLQSTKALLGAAGNQSMELRPENRETAAKLRDAPLTVWNQDLGEDCLAIWNDPAIQKVYTRRAEFQLTDSTA
jgi:guanine nucleotide-binding protein G(i) subunit alpha